MIRKVMSGLMICGALLAAGCSDDDDNGNGSADACAGITELTIVNPVQGSTITVGQTVTVQWCYGASGIQGVNVRLYVDDNPSIVLNTGGQINAPANTFPWNVTANHVGADVYIRVEDYMDNQVYDETGVAVVNN